MGISLLFAGRYEQGGELVDLAGALARDLLDDEPLIEKSLATGALTLKPTVVVCVAEMPVPVTVTV